MSKKKIKWLAPLTAGAFAVAMGITAFTSIQPTYALEMNQAEQVQLMSYSTETLSTVKDRNAYELELWARTSGDGSSREFDGVKYTLSSGTLIATNGQYASEVTETVLTSGIRRGSTTEYQVDTTALDLSQFTNLTKVTLQGNASVAKYAEMLTAIPNDITVVTTGRIKGIGKVTNMKELIICETFCSKTCDPFTVSDEVKTTKCTNVKYAEWTKRWISYWTTVINVNGDSVTRDFVTENDLGYTIEYYLPYSAFRSVINPNIAQKTIYPMYKGEDDIISSNQAVNYLESLNTNVDTYVVGTKDTIGLSLKNSPNTLVVKTFDSLDGSFLLNSSIPNIVLTSTGTSLSVSSFSDKITDLWLHPSTTPETLSSFGCNANRQANLKIHIPNEYKEQYSMIIRDSTVGPNVEYYNMADVDFSHIAIKLNDSKVYRVLSSTKYTIDEINTQKSALEILGYTFTTDDYIDSQIDTALAAEQAKAESGTNTGGTTDNTGGSTETGGNTNSGGTTGTTVTTDAEFISGYKALGAIYYSSDKSLEDVLSIAGNYILQKDGKRYASIEGVKVSFTINGDRLSTTVTLNDQLVSSVDAPLYKLTTTEYGEFIYMQNIACNYGELLIDTDSSTTKNINEIYSYILSQTTLTTSITPTTVTNFNVNTDGSVCDLSTTYVHQNGNTYEAKAEALAFNLDDVIGLNKNISVSIKQVMSPDDDKADPESEYSVKTVTAIYIPATMSAHGIPSAINNSIIQYQNNRYTGDPILHMVTSTNKHDGAGYDITIQGKLPDGIWYQHKVPVTIIDNAYNEAFAVCSDGTIIEIVSANRKVTLEALKTDTSKFMTEVLKNDGKITYAQDLSVDTTKSYYGSKVGDKDLDIVISGIAALEESNANHPVDLSAQKRGYTALSSIVFSSNYSIEDAAKILANRILYLNGSKVTDEYTVKVSTNSKTITIEFFDKNDEKLYGFTSTYKVVKDSKYNFIAATSTYNTGIIIADTQDVKVGDFMNEVMKNVVSLSDYEFESNVMMSTTGPTHLEGTMHSINQNYYAYDYTVEVMDTKKAVAESKVEVNKASISDEIKNQVDEWTNSIKEKMENNKALKYSMIAVGSIFGILLLYGAYLLIRKFCKWLKH